MEHAASTSYQAGLFVENGTAWQVTCDHGYSLKIRDRRQSRDSGEPEEISVAECVDGVWSGVPECVPGILTHTS